MAIQVSRFSEFAEMFAEAEANAKGLVAANTKIDELTASLEYERSITQQQHSRITELESDLAEVVRERDSFRAQYWDADTALDAARGDLDAAQSLLSESRAEVETLKQRIVSLEERLGTADGKNYNLGIEVEQFKAQSVMVMGLANEIISALKPSDWTDPREPLPVPEVAPVPPTPAEPLYNIHEPFPDVVFPSEVQKEPQQADATAPTEHGISDPKYADWDDYSKKW